jgi:hypothetical protein
MKKMKKVLMPIIVPKGNFCFFENNDQVCNHFSIQNNLPTCGLGFKPLMANNCFKYSRVLKPADCFKLKEVKECE